ncbi:tetratricopeptide repeat protein [Streptomyces sp. LARHCF249]
MGEHAERFRDELRAVHEAAGSPKLARLVALGGEQRPPVAPASDTSISAWLTGAAVPGPSKTRFFLVVALFLQGRAVEAGSGYAARPEAWWQQVLSQAQDERARARGGRPRATGRTAPPTGPVTLLSPPSEFTGRDVVVDEVMDWLDPGREGGGAPVVVSGMGGVGKTALVLQAAHQARQRGWFPGGILFADLRGFSPDSELDAAAVTDRFLRALGIKVPPTADGKRDAWHLALEHLAERGRPLLAVLDNIRSPEQITALAPPPPHRVLITSRQTLSDLPAHRVDLDPLTSREAVALLEKALRVGGTGDERVSTQQSDAQRLARLCGYLPLALRITAALLRDEPHRALAGLADDLSGLAEDLDVLAYDGVDEQGRPLAVRACFELSYRYLTGPQAKAFRLVAAAPGTDISTAAATVLLDRPDTRRLLAGLVRAHLVQQSSGDRWSMHDLVRLFADDHGQAEAQADGRKDALDRLLDHYRSTTDAADTALDSGYRDPDRRAELEAALAWLDVERANLIATVRAGAALGRPDTSMNLAFALARYLDHGRHLDDWITVSAIALVLMRTTDSLAGMALALANHGDALAAARRFDKALRAHTLALEVREQADDRLGQAASVGSLGSVRFQMRRFDEAIRDFTRAADMFGELGESGGQAVMLRHLAGVLIDLRRFEEALSILAGVAQTHGDPGDAHSLRGTWVQFGAALAGMRQFEGAVEAFNQAVDVSRQIADPHGEAAALTHLGNTLMAEWRIEEAITVHTRAAELLHGMGDRHGEATARNSLGLCLLRTRRLEEAVEAHTAAAEAFRDSYDTHGEGVALTNIGMVLVQLGRTDEAVDKHIRAAEILHRTGDPHGEGIALNNLGCARRRAGQLTAAIEDHDKAAALFRRTSDRLSEADALNNIGAARIELSQFEEAVAAHTGAADVYREIAERPGEGRASGNLAAALIGMARYEEAVAAGRHAVEIFEAVGDPHGVALAYAHIGRALIELRRFDEAIDACRKAVELFRETNDPAGENGAYTNLWCAIYEKRDSSSSSD